MIRRRVIVHGRVQGVIFRATCRGEARRLSVAGWVRNLPDGTVAAVFEGDPDAVAAMVEWAHAGPERAHVTGVEVLVEDPEGLLDFRVD